METKKPAIFIGMLRRVSIAIAITMTLTGVTGGLWGCPYRHLLKGAIKESR
ncbi:MAG: hypothetical protein ACI8PP_000452 [Candidatus Pseudothioglobus sp.]